MTENEQPCHPAGGHSGIVHDDPEHFRRLRNRVARIEGHTRAVGRMLEEQRSCVDVLHQVQAVQAAWNRVAQLLVEEHVEHCITAALHQGRSDEALEEIRALLAKWAK